MLATLMESHSAGYTNLQEPPARQPAGGPPATAAPGARTPGDELANSLNVPGDTPYALQTEPTHGSGGRQASLARGGRAATGEDWCALGGEGAARGSQHGTGGGNCLEVLARRAEQVWGRGLAGTAPAVCGAGCARGAAG